MNVVDCHALICSRIGISTIVPVAVCTTYDCPLASNVDPFFAERGIRASHSCCEFLLLLAEPSTVDHGSRVCGLRLPDCLKR
jgi:hypothetical protein